MSSPRMNPDSQKAGDDLRTHGHYSYVSRKHQVDARTDTMAAYSGDGGREERSDTDEAVVHDAQSAIVGVGCWVTARSREHGSVRA